MTRWLTRTTAALLAGGLVVTLAAAGLTATESSASSGPMIPAANLRVADGARAFARALLQDASVPVGGVLAHSTDGLVDAMGLPGLLDLVDVHEVYTFTHAINLGEYLRLNRLDGASLAGPSTVSGSSIPTETGYEYTLPFANRHVSYERLDYSLADSRTGAETLRVDAQVVWVPIVTVHMPTTHPVTLTGYDHLSLAMGPSGAVSVTLSPAQARRLERVVASLSSAAGGVCMESSPMFVITTSTRSKDDAKKLWTATAQECPDVLGVVDGTRHVMLDDSSCALRNLVLSDLPRGEATASREALGSCVR